MPLFLRFFHSVRPAMMPDRIVCNSPNVSLVATQLGAHEVSNLGGIDDADNMVGLVQRTRDAETITPGGFQTGVDPLDLLGNQPIQEMAPPIRRIREALGAHLGVA